MSLCPKCKTEQARRKSGRCPNCGIEVDVYDGLWYRKEVGAPTVAVLQYFETLVSNQLTASRTTPVVFSIPRKSARYKRELAFIEGLLRDVAGDVDLIKETLDILFTDKRFNFKHRSSMLYLVGDYDMAMAVAVSNRAQQDLAKTLENRSIKKILTGEDLFN